MTWQFCCASFLAHDQGKGRRRETREVEVGDVVAVGTCEVGMEVLRAGKLTCGRFEQ